MPKDIYFGIPRLELTYVQKEVLRYIAGKVYEWPETRETLQVELGTRYIEKAIGIAYQHVAEALGALAEAGYIIWEKSPTKGVGSLVTFLPEKIKSVTAAVTDSINSVTNAVTNTARSVTSAVTNKKTFFKKAQQTPETVVGVSSKNINTYENINIKNNLKLNSEKTQNNQSDNKNSALNEKIVENLLPPPPSGVVQKVLQAGAKDLIGRGISDIVAAINRIREEMEDKANIKNPNGYFRQLCRVMDVTAPLPVEKVTTDIAGKRQEENERKWQQWEAERRQEEQKKAQREAQEEIQIKKQEDEMQEEIAEAEEKKNIDFVAGLAALKAANPKEVRQVEMQLKKEYGPRIWEFTLNKAEIIIRKFYEMYGVAL